MNKEYEYWKKYYNDNKVIERNDLQKNIGRTKKGESISKDKWRDTIQYIAKLLDIKKSDTIVELCCGNGQVIGNLKPYCNKAIGVDYSLKLLKQLSDNYHNIHIIHSDVLDVFFESDSIDNVIIYFSIQHFTEEQVIKLIANSLKWLHTGGKILIGDIPNELKKWNYIKLKEHRKDYFERLMNNTPMIGQWFNPNFFKALSSYFENTNIVVKEQPYYQINSDYRFDVIITKE